MFFFFFFTVNAVLNDLVQITGFYLPDYKANLIGAFDRTELGTFGL